MLNRLLVTGAAGGLGKSLRPHLKTLASHVRLSDITPLDNAEPHEELVQADLSDPQAVTELVRDCDGIIHLGGMSVESPWQDILNINIAGTYSLFEAARLNGKPRIVFASSNHTIGFYERHQRIDNQVPQRPDSLYGVSKCFGENLASLYYDKFGVETLSVRIGSCFEKPADTRMMATWLSLEDFVSLLKRAFTTPRLGHTVVYGASNNAEQWWDNTHAGFLGWVPRDSSEPWREETEAKDQGIDGNDAAVRYQGGKFASIGHPDDAQ
ncbi:MULTISPECIES: NAD-dependent epimerase/dehydratase family protein [unclassified Halomonas]|uniref:NAD-dependent epimerase/dehydratase family protein n=1 Tax=unclassified Halomonas TaxID=2609666 RepID=UPI0021E3C950|nr:MULTISPECIES: NAD(P)-dependent oxidoreductase [unclassified Halomonas]UYG00749.1 NAD(P)-dependent oxidoreductase [Halomonas sp. GD1P12]WNL41495.1 NAD(P)-dependent oxidoreductase [Halomonas sp. PAMB 3264]